MGLCSPLYMFNVSYGSLIIEIPYLKVSYHLYTFIWFNNFLHYLFNIDTIRVLFFRHGKHILYIGISNNIHICLGKSLNKKMCVEKVLNKISLSIWHVVYLYKRQKSVKLPTGKVFKIADISPAAEQIFTLILWNFYHKEKEQSIKLIFVINDYNILLGNASSFSLINSPLKPLKYLLVLI